MADKREYEVGYGKPPEHTRFKPGKSGNASGRPKGSKNFMTILANVLDSTIAVTENGRKKRISKREAIIMQLVNRSAAADLRAMQLLMDVLRKADGNADTSAPGTDLEDVDLTLIEGIRARMAQIGLESEEDRDVDNTTRASDPHAS